MAAPFLVAECAAPPTVAQTQAALANLPDGFAAMGETLLGAPGITADPILRFAEACAAGARERRELFPGGDMETVALERLAAILRDAAPRYGPVPRLPANAGPPPAIPWPFRAPPRIGR